MLRGAAIMAAPLITIPTRLCLAPSGYKAEGLQAVEDLFHLDAAGAFDEDDGVVDRVG